MTTDPITGAPRPGQLYGMYCNVISGGGSETPMYLWYRNGEVLFETPSINNSIELAPAREYFHNGVWVCEAIKGSLSGRSPGFNITVIGKFKCRQKYFMRICAQTKLRNTYSYRQRFAPAIPRACNAETPYKTCKFPTPYFSKHKTCHSQD